MLGIAPESPASGARFVGWLFARLADWKPEPRPTRLTFTHNLFFSNGKKQNLPKRWITKNGQSQRSRDNFKNSIYQNLCRKKTSRFWKPTQPTTNKAETAKQSQLKPPQTETQAKNLEANFSDSKKWTRNFADERKLVEQKNENLKTCKLKTRLKYRFEKCHR